ncbi:DNA lyase [Pseudoxanthomonas yeongjuensis]|uniref:pyrimidine dimer DNA glycosylase/endonuclease V n=1 Tax=Pseudoxanthomonas yeongjuensis TaxID=377616 RepID=UPI0013908329|nr:pyrimidine dimer DNA glycosylase/endonuclease V [Pseudoxanthomonas yeongjuensis]KAF1716226.1 DNA lyase [Pseudoxanthomonas yeongjuensis]
MRLWTLHPKYLDPQGLVALWREALLARAVLRDETRGYKHHPQLERFKAHASPRLAINAYLAAVHAEATSRGYAFDRGKIGPLRPVAPIPATSGQIDHEWKHLLRKLEIRSPALFVRWNDLRAPECHPLFHPDPGPVAPWERAPATSDPSPLPKLLRRLA